MVGATHLVIPVRDQMNITIGMLNQLHEQPGWDKCWIFDNGSVDGTWDFLIEAQKHDPRFHPVAAAGAGIYDMWDGGFTLAKRVGAEFVGIFNNDLTLSPDTIQILKTALQHNVSAWIAYPDYNATYPGPVHYQRTQGTYRHGGMSGFCFMLRAGAIDWEPLVDPQFKWWGGDDDIAFEVQARGGEQIRVLGLPVHHMMEGTARHHDLGAQKGADLKAVIAKWGR